MIKVEEGLKINDPSNKRQWQLMKQVAKGGFGSLWFAEEVTTKKGVAVKFEMKNIERMQLPWEYSRYQELSPHDTIPKVYTMNALRGSDYHFMIMQLLGKSLKNRLDDCGNFTALTTIQVAIKLLNCIEYLHSKGMIHRDIKPDNFMFGHPSDKLTRRLFTIDLGLSKLYMENGVHIEWKPKQFILGTKPYMSISAHLGYTQSRRDDLEGIGYMLFHFLNGKLPWQGVDVKLEDGKTTDELATHRLLAKKKKDIPISELVDSNPAVFGQYLSIVKKLKFEEDPDYKALKGLFVDYGKKQRLTFKNGGKFDWDQNAAESDSDFGARSSSSSSQGIGKRRKWQ